MANTIYITAGLPVAKDYTQTPESGKNTIYITAGLPPEPTEAPEEPLRFKLGKLLVIG